MASTPLPLIDKQHIVFNDAVAAEAFAAQLRIDAEEGETFEVVPDPKGSGRCIVKAFFNGVFEHNC